MVPSVFSGRIYVMSHATNCGPSDHAGDLFESLSAKGIGVDEYTKIKALLNSSLPQSQVLFLQRFGPRTISSVLREIELWKQSLANHSLFADEERESIAKMLYGAEYCAWSALLALNLPNVGPWTVACVFLPTGKDSTNSSTYLRPGLEIRAVECKTHEERKTLIPGVELNDPALFGSAWKKAFEQLGISDLLRKDRVHKGSISARSSQGWPVFTQHLVPALYEYMHPHYCKPGHHFTNRDEVQQRRAVFPKELLEDMLRVLRLELPNVFGRTTTAHLKAVIQRHLDRPALGTNSSN